MDPQESKSPKAERRRLIPRWCPPKEPAVDATKSEANRRDIALWRSRDLECWYHHVRDLHRNLFHLFQTTAIALGALTPVLIVVSNLPKAIQALPAAISTISVGLMASFHWQENWIRCSYVYERIRGDRYQFLTRTGPYRRLNDEDALERFVTNIDHIAQGEVLQWRGLFTHHDNRDYHRLDDHGTEHGSHGHATDSPEPLPRLRSKPVANR